MYNPTSLFIFVLASIVLSAMTGWVIGRVVHQVDGPREWPCLSAAFGLFVGVVLARNCVGWFGWWGLLGAVAAWPANLLARKLFRIYVEAPELEPTSHEARRTPESEATAFSIIGCIFGALAGGLLAFDVCMNASPMIAIAVTTVGVVVAPYAALGVFFVYLAGFNVVFSVWLKRLSNRLSSLANEITNGIDRYRS
jgi:hypothetical protein